MNSLPFDFHTSPYSLFFKKEPDYSSIQKNLSILDTLTSMNNHSVCVIDFYKHNYFYISPNHLFMCGYTNEEAKCMGERLAEMIIYEEDRKRELDMKNEACLFYASLDIETQKQTSLFSSHRLKHKNGTVFSISNQYKPIFFDDNNKIWMFLGVSIHSTKTNILEAYIEIANTKERFIFSPQKKKFVLSHKTRLTKKEQAILALSSQGYTSKEIALNKNISISTVKFHKKNILIKLNVNNISEAIRFAYSHNLF